MRAPCTTFTAGLGGMGWLLPLPKTTAKESKPLDTRPVYISLCLALSGAYPGENTQDGPLGATISLIWGLPAGLSIFSYPCPNRRGKLWLVQPRLATS